MQHFHLKHINPYKLPLKVWVLAPFVHTNDENLDYYYDFTQSIAEYTKVFSLLKVRWQWQPVTMADYHDVIEAIASEREQHIAFPVVLNICDGDEINGTPGVSVVKLLEEKKLVYTGAEEFFYNVTTSKIAMKKAFNKAKIPTAKWEAIYTASQNVEGIFERLGYPIIVKPSVSGGSMGVGVKNVVYNEKELKKLVKEMFAGYRGWNLVTDGLIAESFITGQEYTSFIVGSYNSPGKTLVYEPVERIFHPSLPEHEKFLSFDRLWEIYDEEAAMPDEENFYEYSAVNAACTAEIKKLSWKAYQSVKGTGYTRIDLRRDKETGKLYVLEVNAQCGISEDENFTSIGAILKVTNKTFAELVKEVIAEAIERYSNKALVPENEHASLVNTLNAR